WRFGTVVGGHAAAVRRYAWARLRGGGVIESQGGAEMGPMAPEGPAGPMRVLTMNAHIEIFRDGERAAPGELGEIVATTLVNRGMPRVRCRVGDPGALSPEPRACGRPQPVPAELQGRAADLAFATAGPRLHG